MFLEDNKTEFFYSELAHINVYDQYGKYVGRTGDALLSTNDLAINSLILFKGFLDEKLEDLTLKENNDPIVPIKAIESIDQHNKKMFLKVSLDDLQTTGKNFVTPVGTINFLILKRLVLHEKNNEKIGRILDIFYRPDGQYSLIVGGSHLEEFLEKIRIIPDKNLIIPRRFVTQIADEITIDLSKIDLITPLHDHKDSNANQNSNLDPREVFNPYKYSWIDAGLGYGGWNRLKFMNDKLYGPHSNDDQRPRND